MSRSFAQLWYTWAINGLEGRSRFQIRAASPSLQGGGRVAELARRLCRYEKPPRVYEPRLAPVSFGWIDSDGYRFIFRRAATEQGEQGQRAAFAAHVLAGPVEGCPVHIAVRLWGADLWQTVDDGGDDLTLKELDPAELIELAAAAAAVPQPPLDRVRNFLGIVLSAETSPPKATFDAEPDVLVGAMRTALAVGPYDFLEGVSFSTYEPPETAQSFDLCGVHVAGELTPNAISLETPGRAVPAAATRPG